MAKNESLDRRIDELLQRADAIPGLRDDLRRLCDDLMRKSKPAKSASKKSKGPKARAKAPVALQQADSDGEDIVTFDQSRPYPVAYDEKILAMDDDEIFSSVRDVLVDALGVDDDEVTPEASLGNDLGAESIDHLDIVFRMERSFGLKIPRGELLPEEIFFNVEGAVEDGKVTEKGMHHLKNIVPDADLEKFAADPRLEFLNNIFTAGMLARYVERRRESMRKQTESTQS